MKVARVSRTIARLEGAMAHLSNIALFLIMIIVVIDVALRYIFNRPLDWAYDVIALYLMVSVFFFALSDTLHHHGHVSIDVLLKYIPKWIRHLGEAIGYTFCTFVFAIVTLQAWERLEESYRLDEVLASAYNWPTSIAFVPLVIGSAVLTLRLFYRAIGHALSIASPEPIVELPPPPEMQ